MAIAQLEGKARVASTVVVDIAPMDYNSHKATFSCSVVVFLDSDLLLPPPQGFALNTTIIDALRGINVKSLTSRAEADTLLSAQIPEAGIRQFVLMNLEQKQDQSWGWKVNLEAIAASLPNLAAWEKIDTPYDGPTTFIGGSNSQYIQEAAHDAIREAFPQSEIRMLPAGHWVHAEKPKDFHRLVMEHFAQLA